MGCELPATIDEDCLFGLVRVKNLRNPVVVDKPTGTNSVVSFLSAYCNRGALTDKVPETRSSNRRRVDAVGNGDVRPVKKASEEAATGAQRRSPSLEEEFRLSRCRGLSQCMKHRPVGDENGDFVLKERAL